jgi:hypothetical protein
MRDMKNIMYILGGLGMLTIAVGTITGVIQSHIKFEDPLNEMVFCWLCLLMGIGTLMNVKRNKK